MTEVVLPVCVPYDHQKRWFHAYFVEGYRRMALVVHRRSGKDIFCLSIISCAAQLRVGTYLYLLPYQKQARDIIWKGVDNDGRPFLDYLGKELIQHKDNINMEVTYKNGSRVIFRGTDGATRADWSKMIGTNPIFIVFGEYSLQSPIAWEYLSPVVRRNKGSVIFQYTPRGINHGYELYQMAKNNKDWYTCYLTVDDTKDHDGLPLYSADDIQKEREEGRDEDLIQQEYYLSWNAVNSGSYFGRIINNLRKKNRIRIFDLDVTLPVFTFWDLGMADAMAIWFMQTLRDEIRFIYYYENSGEGIKHYVQQLSQISRYFRFRYHPQGHYAPHDIAVRELGTGKSRLETAASLGLYFQVVPKLPFQDGIEAVRQMLPKCYFHEEYCRQGIQALSSYSKKYDIIRKVYLSHPEHDWSSHAADAFRYFSIVWRKEYASLQKNEPVSY